MYSLVPLLGNCRCLRWPSRLHCLPHNIIYPTPQPARVHLPQSVLYSAVTSLKWCEVIAGTFLLRIFQ